VRHRLLDRSDRRRRPRAITALDAAEETLAIARSKQYPAGRVEFTQGDAYALPDRPPHDALFAGFWWSHVPLARLDAFLAGAARAVAPGAVVAFLDNRYVEGSSTPLSRRDAEGNTYQTRKLDDGSTHEVLKNFPSERELVERASRHGATSVGRVARVLLAAHLQDEARCLNAIRSRSPRRTFLPTAQGNTGVEYVHVLDSGRPGPSVMVQALTHGNEFCGAIALDEVLKQGIRPAQGTLTLAFANVAAYERFDPENPDRSRFVDEDYNRVWADEVLTALAIPSSCAVRASFASSSTRPISCSTLHSMHGPLPADHGVREEREERGAIEAHGRPADLLLDTGHAAGLRMIERGPFSDPASPRTAILIECGQHWEKSAVDVALDTVLRFLAVTGAVEEGWAKARLRLPPPPVQRLIRVTEAVVAQSMNFRFARPWKGLEVVPEAGTPIAYDGDKEWRTPLRQLRHGDAGDDTPEARQHHGKARSLRKIGTAPICPASSSAPAASPGSCASSYRCRHRRCPRASSRRSRLPARPDASCSRSARDRTRRRVRRRRAP
jgi:hypothetical protein